MDENSYEDITKLTNLPFLLASHDDDDVVVSKQLWKIVLFSLASGRCLWTNWTMSEEWRQQQSFGFMWKQRKASLMTPTTTTTRRREEERVRETERIKIQWDFAWGRQKYTKINKFFMREIHKDRVGISQRGTDIHKDTESFFKRERYTKI